MPEEIIKAKIVFDTKGLTGSLGSSRGGGSGGSKSSVGALGFGKLAAAVGVGNAALKGISKGLGALVSASPRLQAQLTIFKKGLMLVLRPMGDVISTWLKPFLIKFLQFGMKFYQDYQSGGFWNAFKEALNGLDFSTLATALATGLTALLAFNLAKIGVGALAKAFGLPLAAAGLGGAGGTALLLGIVLSIIGITWAAKKLQGMLAEWAESMGLVNPELSDGGFTASMFIDAIFRPKKQKKLKTDQDFLNEAPTIKEQIQTAENRKEETGLISSGAVMKAATAEESAALQTARDDEMDWVDKLKEKWSGFTGWVKKVFTIGESPAIFDYPKILSDNFIENLPPLEGVFQQVFKVGLIQNALIPSIAVSNVLFDSIMKLNRTVVTTHIIRTVRKEG